MEERIREQEAMARAGELTAGIVHEVRNGLGTIVGCARLVERGQDAQAQARAILDECATLETVVRRFNDFVRLERLELAPVDLRPLAWCRPTRRSWSARSRTWCATPSRPRPPAEGTSSFAPSAPLAWC
jgi:signal transduction histidine kinase